jgi:hypothetical protein
MMVPIVRVIPARWAVYAVMCAAYVTVLSQILWKRSHVEAVLETKMAMKVVQAAVTRYRAEHASYCPRTIGHLAALHYTPRRILDGWGHPMVMHCPCRIGSDESHLVSAGRDGVFDTADDIRSWEF